MASSDPIPRFMEEARSILSGGVCAEALNRVGDLMSRAAREPGFLPDANLRVMHQSDSSAAVLQSDADGMTLVLGGFSHAAETPVHDHGAWGVACIVRGADRYRHYDPPGEGAVPQVRFERVLREGDYVSWLEPPDDIHSQQGIDEPALELILFGKNVMRMPRRYFDLASGRIRTALPQ